MSSQYKPPNELEVSNKYYEIVPLYKQLIDEIRYVLENVLKEEGIQISDIQSRVKNFESFYKKIIRKELNGDLFDLVEDIAGIRIICLYRSDLEKVEGVIKKKLNVIKAEIGRKAGTPFGYQSDHYVITLPSHFSGPRYDKVKSLKCEIQVRTVSMHAWDTVSHHLDYKQEVDIPSSLRNDFYALSGVFYVADTLFEQFRRAREAEMDSLKKTVAADKFDFGAEMNLDTFRAYLNWKLSDRKRSDSASVSVLLKELLHEHIDGFEKLNQLIDDNLAWFLEYEKKHPPAAPDRRFSDIGVVRIILKRSVAAL